MSLAKLAGVVILLASGCQIAADTDGPGPPSDSIAGTEAPLASRSKPAGASDPKRSASEGLAHALVSVVSTPATEVEPCERMCGGLGDCLLADPNYPASTAGGLELECLDLCVHSPDDHPARTEFLACSAKDQCAGLQHCAEQRWTALAETRRGPSFEGLSNDASNPCKSGCRWLYACAVTNKPPGEAVLDRDSEAHMQTCIDACDEHADTIYGDDGTHSMMAKLAACLPTHCEVDRVHECWESGF